MREVDLPLSASGRYHSSRALRPRPFVAFPSTWVAYWLNRNVVTKMPRLKAENCALRTRLGRRRFLITNARRRTLASLAKEVDRRALHGLDVIMTPVGLLRGPRDFLGGKWTFLERRRPHRSDTKTGYRPIGWIAIDNPNWGVARKQDTLSILEVNVGRGAIHRILTDPSIESALSRDQRIAWSTLFETRWPVLAASDFFTVEVRGSKGLLTVFSRRIVSRAHSAAYNSN